YSPTCATTTPPRCTTPTTTSAPSTVPSQSGCPSSRWSWRTADGGADRGLRAPRRPPDGGSRGTQRIGRLAAVPALRLELVLRLPARRPRARALAARTGRRRPGDLLALPREHADPRVRMADTDR